MISTSFDVARRGLVSAFAVLAGLAPFSAAQASAGVQPTFWQCASGAGAVTLSNTGCPSGSRASAPRFTAPLPSGISRSTTFIDRSDESLAWREARPELAARPAGTDPFVDCRDIGGRFDLVHRVCHLPAGRLSSPSRED